MEAGAWWGGGAPGGGWALRRTRHHERWVLDVSKESPDSTPEANVALSANYLQFKLKINK